MNSWAKSDSTWDADPLKIGPADYDLMMCMNRGGPSESKYRRMITVWTDITAPTFWWSEFDTYKVGTVRNSCSKMHKIHVKEFTENDFSHEGINEVRGFAWAAFVTVLDACESLRQKFNETQEKKYWRALIELLPEGFNLRATVELNYEVLAKQYAERRNHKLTEWHDFCRWIETLPYPQLIVGEKK